MTDYTPVPPPPPPVVIQEKRKPRVFMWCFLAVQALFLIWIIAAVAESHSGSVSYCGQNQLDCQSAYSDGTAIGVGLVIVFWAVVDVILVACRWVYTTARKG